MNYRIIEGEDNSLYDKYHNFKKAFLDKENTIEDLRRMFDLSYNDYDKLRVKVLNETGLKQKPRQRLSDTRLVADNTYIYNIKGKFHVIKTINQRQSTYGRYLDFETAKKVRDKLIECNWDKEMINDIEKECGVCKV